MLGFKQGCTRVLALAVLASCQFIVDKTFASSPSKFLVCDDSLLDASSDVQAVRAKLLATQVDMQSIREHLRALTGEKESFVFYNLTDRYSPANKELARMYLIGVLQRLGHTVMTERFDKGMNFFVEIPGTESPGEVLEVTAHYDTVSANVPGADDNGSGLGLLLELARLFTLHPPKKTLRLTFMDLEEQGFEGSKFHADRIVEEFFPTGRTPARKFLGALVVDTIGWNPPAKDHPSALVLEIGDPDDYKQAYRFGKDPKPAALPAEEAFGVTLACAQEVCFQVARFAHTNGLREGIKLSVDRATAKPHTGDHGSYWERGIPAWFFAAPFDDDYTNPEYHTPNDKIDRMDWGFYTRAARLAVEMVAVFVHPNLRIANGAKSKRVLEGVLALENRSARRGVDHVSPIVTQPKPKKRAPYYWESQDQNRSRIDDMKRFVAQAKKPHDLILCLEHERMAGDFVRESGETLFMTERDVAEVAVQESWKKKHVVVRLRRPGIVTYDDHQALRRWMKARISAPPGSVVPLPSAYERYEEPKGEESAEDVWAL